MTSEHIPNGYRRGWRCAKLLAFKMYLILNWWQDHMCNAISSRVKSSEIVKLLDSQVDKNLSALVEVFQEVLLVNQSINSPQNKGLQWFVHLHPSHPPLPSSIPKNLWVVVYFSAIKFFKTCSRRFKNSWRVLKKFSEWGNRQTTKLSLDMNQTVK